MVLSPKETGTRDSDIHEPRYVPASYVHLHPSTTYPSTHLPTNSSTYLPTTYPPTHLLILTHPLETKTFGIVNCRLSWSHSPLRRFTNINVNTLSVSECRWKLRTETGTTGPWKPVPIGCPTWTTRVIWCFTSISHVGFSCPLDVSWVLSLTSKGCLKSPLRSEVYRQVWVCLNT